MSHLSAVFGGAGWSWTGGACIVSDMGGSMFMPRDLSNLKFVPNVVLKLCKKVIRYQRVLEQGRNVKPGQHFGDVVIPRANCCRKGRTGEPGAQICHNTLLRDDSIVEEPLEVSHVNETRTFISTLALDASTPNLQLATRRLAIDSWSCHNVAGKSFFGTEEWVYTTVYVEFHNVRGPGDQD
ncbi:hypothetical protein BD779DRAFT_1475727 [Infundibulicybe gibba]|nr:hypothetical protein BD779DRAFT_1475727 [Infundibulicybe gibba]